MLVYGDPQFDFNGAELLSRIRKLSRHLESPSVEPLRELLIQLGQLEQGLADAKDPFHPGMMHLTDLAATAFCAAFLGEEANLSNLRSALLDLFGSSAFSSTRLTVKVPEGFAFYALFPEQYVMAAKDWASAHEPVSPQTVLVLGLRSIGTTLSAVVATTLRALGWKTQRITVRPVSDPFRREVEIDPSELQGVDWALVVDEGPGASGSSMAAAAVRLCQMGMSPERICFFPGHPHGPGHRSDANILSWWNLIRSYHVPLETVRWKDRSLEQLLAMETQRLFNAQESIAVSDISAGKWRQLVFASDSEWPAAAPQFERMKFLCRTPNGAAILWKFCGLAAVNASPMTECASTEMAQRAKRSTSPAPLGVCHGFVAVPWTSGVRLHSSDSNNRHVLESVSDYIIASAGKPLDQQVARSGFDRLSKMLFLNTKESLGDASAELARSLSQASNLPTEAPRFGDGQMSPHEWVRTADGQLVKTNCAGHDCDHTLVGPQPIHWDVAGTIVEWDLNQNQVEELIHDLAQGGRRFVPMELTFYIAAYAAFRLGLCRLATTSSDSAECVRLERAAQHYTRRLRGALRA